MSKNVECIICGTENLANARFCQQCGGQMTAPDETLLMPDQARDDPNLRFLKRDAYFGPDARLSFYIRELAQTIICDFDKTITVGRDATIGGNHLALTTVNAAQYGVSRQHIKLIRSGSTLMVEDLGTKNGTYLNGTKIPEHRPEILSHGDELYLATLKLMVVFRQE